MAGCPGNAPSRLHAASDRGFEHFQAGPQFPAPARGEPHRKLGKRETWGVERLYRPSVLSDSPDVILQPFPGMMSVVKGYFSLSLQMPVGAPAPQLALGKAEHCIVSPFPRRAPWPEKPPGLCLTISFPAQSLRALGPPGCLGVRTPSVHTHGAPPGFPSVPHSSRGIAGYTQTLFTCNTEPRVPTLFSVRGKCPHTHQPPFTLASPAVASDPAAAGVRACAHVRNIIHSYHMSHSVVRQTDVAKSCPKHLSLRGALHWLLKLHDGSSVCMLCRRNGAVLSDTFLASLSSPSTVTELTAHQF